MRFKESEHKLFSAQINSMVANMDAKLTKAIQKSQEFMRMRSDPQFSSDFTRISKKKELIAQINNMEKLMNSLQDDLSEPSTLAI